MCHILIGLFGKVEVDIGLGEVTIKGSDLGGARCNRAKPLNRG